TKPRMIEVVNIQAGDIVAQSSVGPAFRVTDVREPRHPAMPGLALEGHFYRAGEQRWDDRVRVLDTGTDERWFAFPPDIFTIADERILDDEHVTAFRAGQTITVRQRMQWDAYRGTWPITWQKMDAIARSADPRARLYNDTLSGVSITDTWTRTYKIES